MGIEMGFSYPKVRGPWIPEVSACKHLRRTDHSHCALGEPPNHLLGMPDFTGSLQNVLDPQGQW